MFTFIVRRLFQSIIIVIIVSIMVFSAMHFLPGDPLFALIDPNQIANYSEQDLAQMRTQFGFDKPLLVQYLDWMNGALHGDLGYSVVNHTSVTTDIAKRLPITAYIGLVAFVIGIIIGIPAGMISAIRRGTWLDNVVTSLCNFGITIPTFWLGLMLVYILSLKLGWLPVYGYTSPFENFWQSTKQIIMPVICLSIFPIAINARQTRSSMIEVLHQDYIRTAWSKGLRERVVIIRHALKNSLIPIITLAGMGLGHIVGGSVIIEQVFNIPGMGRLAVDSIFTRDFGYVQGITMVVTVVVVATNLLVDIIYGWLDPRIRY